MIELITKYVNETPGLMSTCLQNLLAPGEREMLDNEYNTIGVQMSTTRQVNDDTKCHISASVIRALVTPGGGSDGHANVNWKWTDQEQLFNREIFQVCFNSDHWITLERTKTEAKDAGEIKQLRTHEFTIWHSYWRKHGLQKVDFKLKAPTTMAEITLLGKQLFSPEITEVAIYVPFTELVHIDRLKSTLEYLKTQSKCTSEPA